MTAALFTLAFFPLYLLIRRPFRRIPLHIDCGFYVSNHTISTGRFSFSKGWNAHYAGCSKVLPELFYSLVYLVHCRGAATPGGRYKSMSRLWVSCFNYVTAIAVGVLTRELTAGGPGCYYAGLVAFAVVSSEAHYGVYHECGEVFQLLTDAVSVLLLIHGSQTDNPILVGAAACIWLSGAFYIKLSNVIAFPILFAAAAVVLPSGIAATGLAAALAALSYVGWILWNRQRVFSLVGPLLGHERSFNQRPRTAGITHRLVEKSRTAGRAVWNQPIVPLLAAVGLTVSPPANPLFWLYAAAVVASYAAQATDCRYYLIPLLPPIAVLAACGVMALASWGWMGVAILLLAAVLWIWSNPMRAARMDTPTLNQWSWKAGRPSWEITRNVQLERACEAIRPLVGSDTLLVYGACNQAYVLVGASYPTAIVAPEWYLDPMCPGWQRSLNTQLVGRPPQWILDTGRCFAAQECRSRLGLDYRMSHAFAGDFRLYKLAEVRSPSIEYETARTFGPQSACEVEAEEQRAGSRLARHASSAAEPDPTATALRRHLQTLAATGRRRVAIYGAGRFTIRHADVYREAAVHVACVIDDNAGGVGSSLLGWPVLAPDDVDPASLDAIVVSTDRFTAPILGRIRRLWGDRIPVYAATATEAWASK